MKLHNKYHLTLKPDVYFVEIDEGIWLRSNNGSFTMKGRGIYKFVSGLLKTLINTTPLEDLKLNIDPKHEGLLSQCINVLVERQFISITDKLDDTLPKDEQERYREQIAYLQYSLEQPVKAFKRIQQAEVDCIGSGEALSSTLTALAENGFQRIRVLADLTHRQQELISALQDTSSHSNWNCLPVDQLFLLDPTTSNQDRAKVGILVLDDKNSRRVQEIDALASRYDLLLVVATVGNYSCATHISINNKISWLDIFERLNNESSSYSSRVAMGTAALVVVKDLIDYLSGIDKKDTVNLYTINNLTLSINQHRLCKLVDSQALNQLGELKFNGQLNCSPNCNIFRPNIPSSMDTEKIIGMQNQLVAKMDSLIDEEIGPIKYIGESELIQLPLSGSKITYLKQELATESEIRHLCQQTLVVRGLSPRESRNQTLLFAVEDMLESVCARDVTKVTAIGAGWNVEEAIYRAILSQALLRATTSKGSESTKDARVKAVHKFSKNDLDLERIDLFLLELLEKHTESNLFIEVVENTIGSFTAKIVSDKVELQIGVGLTLYDAINHALLTSIPMTYSENEAVCRPAFLLPSYEQDSEFKSRFLQSSESIGHWYNCTTSLPFLKDAGLTLVCASTM
jgi:hypothetical protein